MIYTRIISYEIDDNYIREVEECDLAREHVSTLDEWKDFFDTCSDYELRESSVKKKETSLITQ